jgi:hypothetical protein
VPQAPRCSTQRCYDGYPLAVKHETRPDPLGAGFFVSMGLAGLAPPILHDGCRKYEYGQPRQQRRKEHHAS